MNTGVLEFQKIYEDFRPKILRYLVRLVGESEAEDLTQEVFIKANKALGTFRGQSKLSTWLYRIATNAALDNLRSPSFQGIAQVGLSYDSIEDDQGGGADAVVLVKEEKPLVEKQIIREEMNDCIRGYVEKLPEPYRAVLVLSEYEGLKNDEIAEILGVTLDTVKIRLHRARAKLKEELETNCEIHWIEEIPCNVTKTIK
ncbi:MAG TPA: sigma-70 family RNA polymerase sigma factor [Anaerolineales bacterium]|nr:sigma-70 family RNA polymerase sigma factor [Anaerolineales bacterium]